MKNEKHTPLPWIIRRYRDTVGFSLHASGSDFGCVAERWEDPTSKERADTIRANGDFVELAVNSHYALLEALIEVEQMIHANEMNEGTMAIVREAITKGLGGA